ncbi:triose-phosphate isomerase [Mesorhizobium sp. RP14(2022)]|uniref:Triosephosphate isomerase n=1 Tax=Mesorhizobium liriopis TaxID=2953882 RepID=A0ABT1C8T6_9HYPH|nr:triose-phosphate isomerase [Mesorhizobium liriopis]MCO6050600.1 triose-phosphate isomerase [Mesorhizobium liriopis]
MTPGIRPLVAGNWKMNGTEASLGEIHGIRNGFMSGLDAEVDALLCLPATLITRAASIFSGSPVAVGGQDCHAKASGAHTGDIAAEMLHDAGARYVIVGHSERRTDHGEKDSDVHGKAEAAWRGGLTAIICVGETDAERRANATPDVLTRQIGGSLPRAAVASTTVIAYEPVWAIGTGLTPTAEDVKRAHAHLRAELVRLIGEEGNKVRILYGGSVKPSNAVELLGVENVDGALVGGASLKASDFLGIAEAYRKL